jgi:dienelactone hydrolase
MKVVCSRRMVTTMMVLVLMSGLATRAAANDRVVIRKETVDGVAYGVWGDAVSTPSPTLFILAGTIDGTLGSAYFRQCGNELADLGYLLVSIDLPCHGTQVVDGKPAGLGGWSHRVGNDENFVAEANHRLSKVLDDLIKTGQTDPDRVAAAGTSRGGFIAIHFTAHDSRVRCAAGFAPVTDLAALSEFRDRQAHPLVAKLNLVSQAEKLAGRPVWIITGDRDERVGTHHAIELAGRLSAVAKERDIPSNVELHVMSEPRGHTTPRGASKLAADWISRQLEVRNPESSR